MTGLYVICATQRRPELAKWRHDRYEEHALPGGYAYCREDVYPQVPGRWDKDRGVGMSPQWIADIGSVSQDPEACFFFVVMRNRESMREAIERGLSLPLVRRREKVALPDVERRPASDL